MRDEARNVNRFSIRHNSDPIARVPNQHGMTPPGWYPVDTEALMQAHGVGQLNDLLNFYGLPTDGTNDQKRLRLLAHLGIPI